MAEKGVEEQVLAMERLRNKAHDGSNEVSAIRSI